MDTRCAVLRPPDVDGRGLEVDLVYPQVHQLADAQRMAIGHEHQQPVTIRIAALARLCWIIAKATLSL